VRVGVNRYVDDGETPHEPRLFTLDTGIGERQIARTEQRKAARSRRDADRALDALQSTLRAGANLMPTLIHAARSGVTLGEMSDVMRTEFGEFREPSPW